MGQYDPLAEVRPLPLKALAYQNANGFEGRETELLMEETPVGKQRHRAVVQSCLPKFQGATVDTVEGSRLHLELAALDTEEWRAQACVLPSAS